MADEIDPTDPETIRKMSNFPLIVDCDMKDEERVECVELVVTALEKFPKDLEAACKMIKETMDKKFGGPFHCVAGTGFSFAVTFELLHKLHLYFGTIGVLLFKAN
eukprot:gnl/Carplike_NY0171/1690_a2282_1173.p1 GENE.gnl/Carplike_NY0171/1690_a2282_1173~~gnl/Carplike_NY0171/1690_a2282_1173.p1  ORF type:complete len:105 (+),score=14.62 gnl/Carplike_NY0171/1690_a2282_1173:3-317(+)